MEKAALLGAAFVVYIVSDFALAFTQQQLFLIVNNKDNNKDEAKDE